jgi:hypothetical protein
MYQITKQSLKDKGNVILLVDTHSEVLEFENLHEAEDFCGILNANANGFKYKVKRVGSTPRHKNTKETINELKTVSFYIDHAAEYGLVPEVVTFALNHMKEDNRLTAAQAMSLGFQDWMK